ncbi:MAG: TIGR03862 family flavoprotein [Chthoniobacterales bacterium]
MHIAVVGGGPAGLRAAEVAADGGASVTVFDAKASVGRKFLVAGRGGLNLTNAESSEQFVTHYGEPDELWRTLLDDCGPEAVRAWAASLGIETFVAKTGRVYPEQMKAAPLLRRWIRRLRELGVQFAMKHRWTGLDREDGLVLAFENAHGFITVRADAVVLALGGGSWPETGSDAQWIEALTRLDIEITPLQPANCGWECRWPEAVLAAAEGKPLKNIVARAGGAKAVGELMVTNYGLEGGAIYQLGPALRAMKEPAIVLDFKPASTEAQLVRKMGLITRNFLAEAQRRWKLSDPAFVIISHSLGEQNFLSAMELARAIKSWTLPLSGPRPLSEAISSAGGVSWNELNEMLMLRRLPGIFLAGEMIDWEAPTGGYLIQGCFATAARAGRGALEWTRSNL